MASIGPLLAAGRRAAQALIGEIAPDVLFATAAEAERCLADAASTGLLTSPRRPSSAGSEGATVLTRVSSEADPLQVATERLDRHRHDQRRNAFDAGLWSDGSRRDAGRSLRRRSSGGRGGAMGGSRQLSTARPELSLG
jgi:hypothetical protein